jgi:PTS system ascorbate-specific IIC component
MDILFAVINFIATQIFQQPAFVLFLVALLGLALQRKSIDAVLLGAAKTALGFLILWAGAGVLVGAISPLTPLLQRAFAPDLSFAAEGTWAGMLEEYGGAVAWTMFLAFGLNVLLARITPWKYVFLTGHIIFQIASVSIAVGVLAGGFSGIGLIIWATVVTGLIMTFGPALTQPWTRKVIDGDDFALGHAINFMTVVGAWLGKVVGNPEQDAEKIKFPERLSFLTDPLITAALILCLLYVPVCIYLGPGYVSETYSGSQNYLLWAFLQSLNGAVGLGIIFHGAKLMLAEIVPAFRGISRRIVPNAIPALDMPVLFPYGPTSLMIGFLCGTVAGLISMFILGFVAPQYIFFPAMIPCFFDAGTVAIYANKTGGIRGVIVSSLLTGAVVIFGGALVLPWTAPLMGDFIRQFTDNDYATVMPILGWGLHFLRTLFGF